MARRFDARALDPTRRHPLGQLRRVRRQRTSDQPLRPRGSSGRCSPLGDRDRAGREELHILSGGRVPSSSIRAVSGSPRRRASRYRFSRRSTSSVSTCATSPSSSACSAGGQVCWRGSASAGLRRGSWSPAPENQAGTLLFSAAAGARASALFARAMPSVMATERDSKSFTRAR